MLYIVAAMHCEAKPLIRQFGLKRDDSARFFEIYRNEDKALVLSGVGKMRSAIATSHILSRLEPDKNSAIVNIGTCGSVSKSLPIGSPVLINKIKDGESGREYYPDILLRHIDMQQGFLETHNKVITCNDIYIHEQESHEQKHIHPDFVDMEASGFFQAAERFVGPHQIYVVKVISDYLEGNLIDKAYIADCMEKAMPDIEKLIDKILIFQGQAVKEDIFTSEDSIILKKLISHLRLTNYQTHQLYDMARAFKIRTGSKIPEFEEIMSVAIKTKEQSKKFFNYIEQKLTMIRE